VLLPLTAPAAGTKAHFLSCTRAVEKIRTSGCASPPHSRLEPKRIFLSCKRAVKNENKRLCFFPPVPAGTKKKRAGTKAHVSVLRARSEEKEGGLLCFFPPLPAGTKAHFLSCTRAVEKIRTSGCASPPHSRLEPKRVFLSCTLAVTPFETSGFFNLHKAAL